MSFTRPKAVAFGSAVLAALLLLPGIADALTGAIQTSDSTCTVVNENHYADREDVYLDGGPQNESAKQGLPDGAYYVQITEPDGTVLGTSPTAFVHVSGGEFETCYQLWPNLVQPDGSIGYAETTNPGGEYKVWASPSPEFANDESKTDNFKVEVATVVVPKALELGALAANGTYTITYAWDVTKAATKPVTTILAAGAASLGYSVSAVRDAGTLSGFAVGGTVVVSNPNESTQPLTGLAVSLGTTACVVAAPAAVAAGDTAVGFTCAADAESLDDALSATLADASAAGTVAWTSTSVNESAHVVDSFNGTAPVTLSADQLTNGYTNSVSLANAGCRYVANTATVVSDDAGSATLGSATATVAACLQAGGHTIGFWQNKNGQSVITNAAGLTAKLASYGAVWNGTGFSATFTGKQLAAWVTSVMSGASSVDAVKMYRAQFLATALAGHTNVLGVNLLNAGVTSVGTGTCVTVAALLDQGNAYAASTTTRDGLLVRKSQYDRINNNIETMCVV
jgi:hypothetical protein